MTKYGANKTVVGGITFDSKQEADYYEHLLVKQKAGYIKEIELQPVLNIMPAFNYYGKKRRKMDYKLDFHVTYHDDYEVWIDIKGFATADAKMKRKITEYMHKDKHIIWIAKSIKYGDRFGWIEYDELVKKRAEAKRKKK